MGDKNVVEGDIKSNQYVHVGDKTTHYHTKKNIPKELTTKLPRFRHQDLIGREEALESLHQQLFDNQQVVVVNGMGGLGKTALAQGYISKYYEEYAHIAWISFNSESDQVQADFIGDTVLLNNFNIDTAGKTIPDIFKQLMYAFKGLENSPCLLVLDNATADLVTHYDWLPNQPHWHLLATSRSYLDNFQPYELSFLSTAKAVELFRKHYTRQTLADSFLEQLVEELEHHTLTIEILAKMAQQFRYGEEKLQAALPSNLQAKVTTKHSGSTQQIARITDYLCAIFEWQLEALDDAHKKLLVNFSCLPADYHEFDLLVELLVGEGGFERDVLSACLDQLDKTGWLLSGDYSYKMHILIQKVTKFWIELSQEDISALLATLASKLKVNQSIDNPTKVYPWMGYAVYVLRSIGYNITLKSGAFYNNFAIALSYVGLFDAAKIIYTELCKFYEELLPDSKSLLARSYSGLANTMAILGEFEEAKELLLKAVAIDEDLHGFYHENTSNRYSSLAMVLRDNEEFEEAKRWMQKAIKVNEHIFGSNNGISAIDYSNYSLILQNLNEIDEAELYVRKALFYQEKNLGSLHPSTAISYSNLASIMDHLGKFKEARKLLEKAVTANETNFGTDHPETARTYSNLALLYINFRKFKEAKDLLEKAVLINEDCFGVLHHHTAITYGNLSLLFLKMKEYKEAEIMARKAFEADQKNFGSNHVHLATNYAHLAKILYRLNNINAAFSSIEIAYDIIVEYSLTEHPIHRHIVDNFKFITYMRDLKKDNPFIFKLLNLVEQFFPLL